MFAIIVSLVLIVVCYAARREDKLARDEERRIFAETYCANRR